MKGWLKYLLPIVVVVAFWNCTEEPATSASEVAVANEFIQKSSFQTNLSESQPKPCLPRQTSITSAQVIQTYARKSSGIQRTHIVFAKSGKTVNTALRFTIQKSVIDSDSSLTEPGQRLHCLGKLII